MAIGAIRPYTGLGPIRPHKSKPPILRPDKVSDLPDDLPPEIQRLIAIMGERNARTVWRMQKRGIRGTSPELLVYDWLERKRVPFEFQSGLFGGRKIKGGLVCDFIVWVGARPMAWRVQGEHWHVAEAVQRKDEVNKIRLLLCKYRGQKFVAVVDLWEAPLYKRLNHTCEDAMRGRSSK